MAKILGVSQATFARIESGAQNVTLATLTRFCHALRSKPGDLFEPGRLKLPRRR
jgi:DNA-binding Xre family transcriptional regulator